MLAVNYSPDPLPYVRPSTFAVNFTGRPDGARIQRRGLEELTHRWAAYAVAPADLPGPGPYKVRIRFLAGMVPINLVTEIKVAGFDYNMSRRGIGRHHHQCGTGREGCLPFFGSAGAVANVHVSPAAGAVD